MARSPLILGSIVFHVALGVTFFATGVWKLERLEGNHRDVALAVMSPPVAPEGGGDTGGPKPVIKPKRRKEIAKEMTQPPVAKPDAPDVDDPQPAVGDPGLGGGGQGSASGPGIGNGPPDRTGDCVGPDCSVDGPPAPQPKPVAVVTTPKMVPPTILSALRTSGTTQIFPADLTKTAMLRDGRETVTGTLQICLSASGGISSVTVRASTKYPDFDRKLVEAARQWHYQPLLVNGSGQPVCGMTTFVYTIR